jgi:MinD-like ATPase involved in chromosome partitioning or flagellar assembly
MTWGISRPTAAANPLGGDKPVTILVAGEPARAQALYGLLVQDARFQVLAMATSADDARVKLAMRPEAALIEGQVFSGPGELTDIFGEYPGVCYVLLPADVPEQQVAAVRQAPCVKEALVGEVNLSALAGQVYAAVLLRRQASLTPGGRDAFRPFQAPGGAMIGWRAVAVWSPQGGVGKSTFALALALEAASRRLPALLVGLGAPDPLPLMAGLNAPEPNLVAWTANPTVDGLRACVRQVHGVSLLAGFPDLMSLLNYNLEALSGPKALGSLAYTAAQAGFVPVIFDVSAPELAAAALSAANTLVLVARPDVPGVLAAAEGTRVIHDVMAGQHRIPPEAIHLVVNGVRQTTLSPNEVVSAGSEARHAKRDFPSLAAAIADDPQVEAAANEGQPAYFRSDELRRAARTLGDLLFAGPPPTLPDAGRPGRVIHLGPIRIRV